MRPASARTRKIMLKQRVYPSPVLSPIRKISGRLSPTPNLARLEHAASGSAPAVPYAVLMGTLTFERPICHDAFSHVFGSRRGIGVVHLDASAPSRVERDEAQR